MEPIYIDVPIYKDDDIQRALKWFLSFMSEIGWATRKAAVEKVVQIEIRTTRSTSTSLSEMLPLSVSDDKIGWYLYLMECLLYDITKYELVQGARVAPIFKRIGIDLEIVKNVGGIETKIKRLLKKEKSQADETLFEILVALVWAKNGWEVSFIPEEPPYKRADLLAKRGTEEKYIECKRQNKSSAYSENERDKWLTMFSFIKNDLIEKNILLDVVFHVELSTLDDKFIQEQLSGKLQLIVAPSHIISNEFWDVHVSFVDIKAINDHLDHYYVKNASTQLQYLIGGEKKDSTGFTSGMMAKYVTVGDSGGNNLYVERIEKAFGAHWKCDCLEAINAKARDIWKQLKAAVSQIPADSKAVIHVGIETHDGPDVDNERLAKISKTVSVWDDDGTENVEWVYCHFFQSYAPPDQVWVIDETITSFSKDKDHRNNPLGEGAFLIIPWDVPDDDDVHWHKPQP